MSEHGPDIAGEGGPGERERKILHVDLDAFFASVEQRDDPSLRGRPVAVGGSRERGVVAAASYEARRFGVRSAMPSSTARRLCPELVFVKPRFEAYREASARVREIFLRYTDLVEPMSLDEAYLDVTENKAGLRWATEVARAIRADVRVETGLTASAGVAGSKFLAKMASDMRKPDGMFVILPHQGAEFIASLPIGRFHGIGPATEKKMFAMGVFNGADLRQRSMEELVARFGKSGSWFYWISRGVDRRPVVTESVRKSAGAEITFDRDLFVLAELEEQLRAVAAKAWERCVRTESFGRTVTLKAKHGDFTQVTRSRTYPSPVDTFEGLAIAAEGLLGSVFPAETGIRLLGVTVSGFPLPGEEAEEPQLSLGL